VCGASRLADWLFATVSNAGIGLNIKWTDVNGNSMSRFIVDAPPPRNSAVGTVPVLRTAPSGFESWKGLRIIVSQTSRLVLGVTQPASPWVPGAVLVVQRRVREDDYCLLLECMELCRFAPPRD
jgi:hypothetical protein